MKILLISGHGAGDSGAVSKFGKEADLTIEQVKKIKPYLDKYADVTIYPTERNAYNDIQNGNLKVKFADYDYVLEVHFNACVNDITGDGKTTGTEIYVTTSEATVGVETAIVANIAALGLKNRGVKKTDFLVIRTAKRAGVSSALVEVCFIDDKDDMTIYNNKKDSIAQAIAKGVISGFKLTAGTNSQASEKTPGNATQKVLNACKNEAEFLALIAPLCQADYAKHKILPSLSIAQACLESGYGTSDLYMYGGAAFGIKASSGWTGKVYRKSSKEVINGTTVFQDSDFRAYTSLANSVSDHGEFLQKDRYKAVVGETNFQKAAAAIKAAGYATDPEYVSKLTSIYTKHQLSKYDSVSGASSGSNSGANSADGFSVGEKVAIKSGAVYGGLSGTRGKAVPAAQCGVVKHTITELTEHKGVMEAKLKEINSWVALGYLSKTATAAKTISSGSKVTIKSGAVYGGLSSTRGKAVPAAQCGSKKHTVSKIATNKGVKEALLKEINSWVAVSSLNIV